MNNLTLNFYFARHFTKQVMFVFFLFLFLIIALDLIELSRTTAKQTDVSSLDLVKIALFRAPQFARHILPFAILFGAATSLMLLNRRLELVVARASGISVWQFIAPYVIVATGMGLFNAMVYNPLALSGVEASYEIEAKVFGKVEGGYSNKSQNFWLRVGSIDGDIIVRSKVAQNSGEKLSAVTIYRFGNSGTMLERLDADEALFAEIDGKNYYRLQNVIVTAPGQAGVKIKTVDIPIEISRSQLQINTTRPESVSFWNLLTQAARAEKAGRNPLPFLTAHQSLLSKPLLFVAMALLAAGVSLRFIRIGQSGLLIFGGILTGFVLYVSTVMVLSFGSNGLVSPALAAWSPACVATLIGATLLLHQEDG
ncbi:MAG: LPS export ABC transporter permease LptG [Hyphomicrobiales bacterium]|nr:LptF/LptG family permease [Ahrensia sp. AH-315-G08]PCH48127.1 MAG: LPS export ABC transporter permease LptG [Hyphomicrobiales bacterium]